MVQYIVPEKLRQKARRGDEVNKPLRNQINYVLVCLQLDGRHNLKPTHEELKEWLHDDQLDLMRMKQ
jgi:hypothetical protein